ncbi:hypothetical protein GWI33_010733 [Rhynchophorus ferrugineus]|uniref:Uncharacterized protein n=1 Tax=Rhynchophorus ferrugineus TaxID=354439 RepID=A0A834MFA6_RHYFE|nr:hypothetical protein GWI33_010733 [Rhynchophorus ferrugineus]
MKFLTGGASVTNKEKSRTLRSYRIEVKSVKITCALTLRYSRGRTQRNNLKTTITTAIAPDRVVETQQQESGQSYGLTANAALRM